MPERSDGDAISIFRLFETPPDEAAAEAWFEKARWPAGERSCTRRGSVDAHRALAKYWGLHMKVAKAISQEGLLDLRTEGSGGFAGANPIRDA